MKTVPTDLKNTTNNGQLLWQWLGQFWQRIYQNPEFAKDLQYGQGLLSAQLYLDFVENLHRINRNTVPVFHRERWKPLRLLKSQAGTGDAALLRVGAEPSVVLGPQTSSAYVQDQTFQIGGTTTLSSAICYPLTGVVSVMVGVCDSILSPKSVLLQGTDFTVVDSTIFFLRDKDPFSNPAFPTRKFQHADGSSDEELILWCMDTLEERDYVYNQLGYVFNVKMPSSELYLNMINRLWDLYNAGAPLQLFQAGVAAILDEPIIKHAQETVVKILIDAVTGATQVITDLEVYVTAPTAFLRAQVYVGAVLTQGELLTETVRVYSDINPQRLNTAGEYGARFRTDVPAMFFGADMFRSDLKFGFGASWELSDIVSAGLDAHGNPKLKFEIFGDTEDVARFWSDFWAYCELNNISSATCFTDYLDPVVGRTYGRVAPLEYFLRYFLRANLCMVVVDYDALTDAGRDNMNQLQLLAAVLPAHVLMLVTVERHVAETPYNLGDIEEVTTPMAAVVKTDTARPGGPSSLSLTYRDRCPILRWIPTCGRSA